MRSQIVRLLAEKCRAKVGLRMNSGPRPHQPEHHRAVLAAEATRSAASFSMSRRAWAWGRLRGSVIKDGRILDQFSYARIRA